MRWGGEVACQSTRDILIEHNLRLVIHVAKKFYNTRIDPDDLFSIGTIGLIKAVNTFKPDKNIKLATYASRCISNEILMYLRRAKHMGREVSIDEPLSIDANGNELVLADILPDSSECVSRVIEAEAVRGILESEMQKLRDRDRHIIELRFGVGRASEPMCQRAVADHFKISQSYVSRLERIICQKLKKQMARVM